MVGGLERLPSRRHVMSQVLILIRFTLGYRKIEAIPIPLPSMTTIRAMRLVVVLFMRGMQSLSSEGSLFSVILCVVEFFNTETKDPQSGRLQKISELRLSFDGVEWELPAVTTMDDSYSSGQLVDPRLSMDALGELYMLTKSDGWVRKVVRVSQ